MNFELGPPELSGNKFVLSETLSGNLLQQQEMHVPGKLMVQPMCSENTRMAKVNSSRGTKRSEKWIHYRCLSSKGWLQRTLHFPGQCAVLGECVCTIGRLKVTMVAVTVLTQRPDRVPRQDSSGGATDLWKQVGFRYHKVWQSWRGSQ